MPTGIPTGLPAGLPAGVLFRALWGALRAPPLPERQTYTLYARPIPAASPHTSTDPAVLQARLLATLAQHTLSAPWSIPGASEPAPPLSLPILAAALVSPVDHYTGPIPAAYLPTASFPKLCTALAKRATREGRPLDVCEQFEVAMVCAGGRPLAAGLMLHSLTRVLARGQDRRLGAPARLWLDERLDHGRNFAPFSAALRGAGDTLGDLAAYWSCSSAGMASAWARHQDRPLAGRLLQVLFYAGPTVRGRLRTGPFGDHARVARLGLRHGLALGVATLQQQGSTRRAPLPPHTDTPASSLPPPLPATTEV